MSDRNEDYEVVAHARYEWDCMCGNVNDEDHDPSGEDVECVSCGDTYRITETR